MSAYIFRQSKQLRKLRKAIMNRPPYCNGTVPVQAIELSLFYGEGEQARQINFNDANDAAFKHLINACKPAIFGRNNEDVYDESYRKASELDQSMFAVKLKVGEKSLLNIAHTQLLKGRSSGRRVEAELYKLNVYGEGSFFKSHKDTRAVEGCLALLSLYIMRACEALSLRSNLYLVYRDYGQAGLVAVEPYISPDEQMEEGILQFLREGCREEVTEVNHFAGGIDNYNVSDDGSQSGLDTSDSNDAEDSEDSDKNAVERRSLSSEQAQDATENPAGAGTDDLKVPADDSGSDVEDKSVNSSSSDSVQTDDSETRNAAGLFIG